MRRFVTGDLHGCIDIHRLSSEFFPKGKDLTKDDVLIVCGDFGLLWDESKEEHYWRNWLASKPWTTLTVWGNHENFNMIEKLETTTMFGGPVDVIKTSKSGNMYGLKHGHVYTIGGETFFVMGGGTSIDAHRRKEGVSWWPQEHPSPEDWERAWDALKAHNYQVDYILTHASPAHMVRVITGDIWNPKNQCTVALKLDDIYTKMVNEGHFKTWFFGHMHEDRVFAKPYQDNKKLHALYYEMFELGETNV